MLANRAACRAAANPTIIGAACAAIATALSAASPSANADRSKGPVMTSLSRSATLSLLTAGLIGAAVAPLAAQTDPGTVRVGSMSIDAFGEAYYGLDRGIFSDNGINMQVST